MSETDIAICQTEQIHTGSQAIHISSDFKRSNTAIERIRNALISFGNNVSLFATNHTDFPGLEGHPTTAEFLESATVEALLGTISNSWDPEIHGAQYEADPWNIEAQHARSALLDFTQEFGLFECQCIRRPNCVHGKATEISPLELFELLDEEWHGQAGCYQHLPTDSDEFVVQRQLERNFNLLQKFSSSLSFWPNALQKWQAIRETRWYLEAKHLAIHCADTWCPNLMNRPEVQHALLQVRSLSDELGWGSEASKEYIDLMCDVFIAILTYKVVTPPITQALYEPVCADLPFQNLFC